MAVNKPDPVRNLGHKATDATLTKNPIGRPTNYDSGDTARTFRDRGKLQGVYTTCSDPRSGIASQANLDKWADYSTKDSYHGKDPKGRGAGSDEHLAPLPKPSTDNWANYSAGSDSGEGRLQKAKKY
jgi:hypothetical protein